MRQFSTRSKSNIIAFQPPNMFGPLKYAMERKQKSSHQLIAIGTAKCEWLPFILKFANYIHVGCGIFTVFRVKIYIHCKETVQYFLTAEFPIVSYDFRPFSW